MKPMATKRGNSYSFPGSTRIAHGKYDPERQKVTLTFVDGVDWVYERVPESTWKKFKAADSAGRFLAAVLDRYPNHRG